MKSHFVFSALAAALVLVACGGGGDSSSVQAVDRAVPVVINAVPPQ